MLSVSHLPEGAVPKDGPSAGISMACAVVSALTRRPVRDDIAMTGEVTLTGRVLPIGGVKEKVLAAKRYRIPTVLLPKENMRDLKEIPENVLADMDVRGVESMDDVLRISLLEPVKPKAPILFEAEQPRTTLGFKQ